MISAFLFSFLAVLVIALVLIAAGLGFGAILHWLIPAIDLGMSVLICELSLIVATYAYIRGASSQSPSESFDETADEPPMLVLEQYPFRKRGRRRPK